MKKFISIEEKTNIYENESFKKRREYILNKDFDEISWDLKREYLIYENNNICKSCGLQEWKGFKIPIEVNHIDGNNTNHSKENLECLCPNCHSITKNWRGRNKTQKRFKISNKKILEVLLINDWNMRKSLIEVGLTPKGGNYNRCHQIKREYEEFGLVITEIKKIPEFEKDEFEIIFNKFETYIEICKYLGISRTSVVRICDSFGLKKSKITIRPEKDVLLDDFFKLKKFTEVGRKYGVSDNSIRKWCKKYDILEEVRKK
jgi:hypothetical protein